MKLISINVGSERQLGELTTGIFKSPCDGSVSVGELGLENDVICDGKYHGGPDQAIYVYGMTDYAYWSEEHQLDLEPGTFGENLSISGLSSLDVRVGDQFQIESTLLEATSPRIPCGTLGSRMGDPKFPVAFRRSGRSGFYCRVLKVGIVSSGMTVKHVPSTHLDHITIKELFDLTYNPNPSKEEIDQVLTAPIAIRERQRLLSLREKLLA